jgi:hypothetical protein
VLQVPEIQPPQKASLGSKPRTGLGSNLGAWLRSSDQEIQAQNQLEVDESIMTTKKGLSDAEKRTKMSEIFLSVILHTDGQVMG